MNSALFRMSIAVFFVALFTLAACGGDSGGGSGSAAQDTGAPDAGNDSGGSSDTGGTEDTGGGSGGGECAENCPTALASAGENPRIIFESIQFGAADTVTIRNLSGEAVNLDGYQICRRPFYAPLPAVELAAGAALTIHMNVAGTNTDTDVFIEIFSDLTETSEFNLYSDNNFTSADSLVAFVAWGGEPGSNGRIDVAVDAGLWTAGDFITTCEDSGGFIAVGNVSGSNGWRAVTDACFE